MVCPSSWSKINLFTPSHNQITLLFWQFSRYFENLPCFYHASLNWSWFFLIWKSVIKFGLEANWRLPKFTTIRKSKYHFNALLPSEAIKFQFLLAILYSVSRIVSRLCTNVCAIASAIQACACKEGHNPCACTCQSIFTTAWA